MASVRSAEAARHCGFCGQIGEDLGLAKKASGPAKMGWQGRRLISWPEADAAKPSARGPKADIQSLHRMSGFGGEKRTRFARCEPSSL